MVFSVLFKFPAIATTYVGNFTGNCTIQLNGQAIVVINRGVEINRWPYNCIRQFRAEDESGKFSFVSGRRGPYGVAEYNFKLLNDSLVDLQSVLTEFTGAQFSAVAPGSGTEQQVPQPQPSYPPQPVTSYPPTLPRPSNSSSSNAYTTSIPRHMTPGRNDSTSSDQYPDSVFNSPARQAPILPPRDYTLTTPNPSSSLSYSADETSMRELRGRARTATSGSTNTFGLDIGTYSTPRPALPPPRREAKEPSPEVMVAKSSSYEEAHLTSQHGTPPGKTKGDKPALPTKKKSLFNRSKKSQKNSASHSVSDISTDSPADIAKADTKPLANGKPLVQSHDRESITEEVRQQASNAAKESPYDHLPSEKEVLEGSKLADANPSSGVTSPIGSDGKMSPDSNECSNLDFIPRSSPTVQARSITPEHAQHLKKLNEIESPSRMSASVRGRRSPPQKLAKKSNTISSINVRGTKVVVPSEIQEDDSLYNVPKPVAESGLYQTPKSLNHSPPSPRDNAGLYRVPKSVMDSPPSPRGGSRTNSGSENVYSAPRNVTGSQENLYSAPRPVDQSAEVAHSQDNSVPSDAIYKVPSSLSAEENDVSRQGNGLYNVPQSLSGDMVDNAAYNDARSTLQGATEVYSTPRPANTHVPASPSNLKNNYESIDVDVPTSRSTRSHSLEGLHGLRVNQLEAPRSMTGYISSPAFGNKPPKCEYVDIELDSRVPVLAPAKNAPLPPLPTPAGPDRVVDSVYAEIGEDAIAGGRHANVSHTASFSELPQTTHHSTTAQEGMAKAQELAEEEGYELFMPATVRRSDTYAEVRQTDSTYPPATSASAVLQKYNINIHDCRIRPLSESDVLDDSHKSGGNFGTSIPNDSDLSDEYVIVTGPDLRPKPKHLTSPTLMGEQYEAMNSAQHIMPENHYSAPIPTHSSVPQPQLSGQGSPGQIVRQSSAGRVLASVGSAMPPLPPRKYSQEDAAGIDLDMMSPADEVSAPLYSNFEHDHLERRSSNHSSSSGRSEGGVEVDGNTSEKNQSSLPIPRQSSMVKIMAGSPMDGSDSAKLKNRTRSHGNVLDSFTPPNESHHTEHSQPSSSTHTPSSSPPCTHAKTSQSPPSSKRHNYINISPKDGEDSEHVSRQTTESATKANKRPRPLPRSSLLLKGDSS